MADQVTSVRLMNVPFSNDYSHTLYFETKADQTNYFITKGKWAITSATYLRKEGVIRFPKHFDDIQDCNYIMYRNGQDASDKWYYGFITNIEYKNDELSNIYFEIDVIQTYLFDYEVQSCFIEREHVSDDTVGANTVPENLEMGEYIAEYDSNVSELNTLDVVFARTDLGGARYDGLVSGLTYIGYDGTDTKGIQDYIAQFADGGIADALESIFIAPRFLANRQVSDSTGLLMNGPILGSENPKKLEHKIGKPILGKARAITPRNKKLLTYPYKYLLISNNNGGSAVYKYENFSDDDMTFNIYGALTPGCSIRLIPKNYKGVLENNEEGLNLGKYPICNWTSDVYTNWLTQNSVNIALDIVSGAGEFAVGALIAAGTGGVGGAFGAGYAVTGVTRVTNTLSQIHQMSFVPPQAKGNVNCGDVTTVTNNNTFTFYGMTIKNEYIRIIDEFFDMYGYKINRVKYPLKAHRENYWYTKTIDCYVEASIPMKDKKKIEECYNNGITFWRHPENLGNYNVSNYIV